MDKKEPKEKAIKDSDDPENPGKDGEDDIAKIVESYFDGTIINLLMAIITIFSLFGDDIRVNAFDKEADLAFQIIYSVSFFLFLLEIVVFSIVRIDYKWSFFFWLDLVATFSIIADLEWLWEPIQSLMNQETSDEASGTRSTQATKVGARASRIVRLVRLIRLVRIVKLYKYFSKANDEDEDERLREQAKLALNAKQAALKRVEASRLGKYLSEQTTRKVIVGVLVMLLVLPFLEVSPSDNGPYNGLRQLFWFGRSSSCPLAGADTLMCPQGAATPPWTTVDGWRRMLYEYAFIGKDIDQRVGEGVPLKPLLWIRLPNFENGGNLEAIPRITTMINGANVVWEAEERCGANQPMEKCPYRKEEIEDVHFYPQQCTDRIDCRELGAHARFLKKLQTQEEALWSIGTTLFVCCLLAILAWLFSQDTQNLVIAPIEKMVNIVKQLANDPLRKPDLSAMEEEEPTVDGKKKKKKDKPKGPQLETSVLEHTILKIGQLLQVGFGEAGAAIIGNNMRSGDGELNIMIPGKKVKAVFGFLDIRRFTDVTEALQEDVMHFVNLVGRISHQCTHRWEGAANKNVGDAFLFTWKVDSGSELVQQGPSGKDKQGGGPAGQGQVGDQHGLMRPGELANKALIAFVKCLVEIRRSPQVKDFENDNRMKNRFQAQAVAANRQKRRRRNRGSTEDGSESEEWAPSTDGYDNSQYGGDDFEEDITDEDLAVLASAEFEYKLRCGYALHYGWAIEGAIGSDYKIDASYLSPHVSFVEKLQEATKGYVVPLLMSEPFYNKLSGKAKSRVRKIDVVRTNLIPEPVGIYCFDVNDEEPVPLPPYKVLANSSAEAASDPPPPLYLHNGALTPGGGAFDPVAHIQSLVHGGAQPPPLDAKGQPILDPMAQNVPEGERVDREWHLPGDIVPPDDLTEDLPLNHLYGQGAEYVFAFDRDIEKVQEHLPKDFLQTFRIGFCFYAEGEWEKAKDFFDDCLNIFPKDGPTLSLYAYMELHDFKPPADWEYCRDFEVVLG